MEAGNCVNFAINWDIHKKLEGYVSETITIIIDLHKYQVCRITRDI